MRHNPNLLMTPCGRPHLWQRLYSRTLNFCGRAHLTFKLVLAILLISSPLPSERHAHELKQGEGLGIGLSRRDDDNVHTTDLADLIVINLWEDQLFFDP